MKQIKPHLPSILFILILTVLVFRKFFFQGLLPIPYNILVNWYFPYNTGGWELSGTPIPYKGGLFAADVFRQMIPWKQLALELIKQGQLPLWNPHNFSGEPLLANIQATIFYPLTILFFFLNFDTAWSYYIILSPLLAALFTYLFLSSLKLSKSASLLGSLAFSLSGHMISWLEWGVVTHSGLWLPLSLYSIHQLINHHKFWAIYSLIFSIYATILGGYPQQSAYALLVFVTYTIYSFTNQKHSYKKTLSKITQTTFFNQSKLSYKKTISLLLFLALSFSLLSFQLIPTYQLFQNSALKGNKSEELFLRTRLEPRHLLTAFSSDYYGNRIKENYFANIFTTVDYTDANLFIGTPALIFALYSLLTKSKNKTLNFFKFALLISLLLSIKSPLTFVFAKLHLPMITTGVAAGILYISVISLSILSAFGVDNFQKKPKLKPLAIITSIYLLVLASTLLIPMQYRTITIRNLIIPLTIAVTTLSLLTIKTQLNSSVLKKLLNFIFPNSFKSKLTRSFSLLLIPSILFLSSAEYLKYTHLMLSFSSPSLSYPPNQLITKLKQLSQNDRIMGFWDSEISNDLHTQFRLYSPEGYNPLHSKTYQEFTAAAYPGNYQDFLKRSDADVPFDYLPGRDRFLDLTSTRYIPAKVTNLESDFETEPLKYDQAKFDLIWQQDKFKIYQNKTALPRVSLYSNFQVIAEKQTRLQTLYSPSFDPHQTIILEEKPSEDILSQANGNAKIISYTPNQIVIHTDTKDGNTILLLTDSYYPNWNAYIDHQPTKIYRANHTFRAIIVPQGQHQIEFKVSWSPTK